MWQVYLSVWAMQNLINLTNDEHQLIISQFTDYESAHEVSDSMND